MFCPFINDSCNSSCVFKERFADNNCSLVQGVKDLGEINKQMKIKNDTLESVDKAINFIAKKS